MRIVSGIYRGRVLSEFKGNEIRPTADNVRESLFNILQTRIGGSVFLDLYCGTGAVGIEGLSRGADKVYFNDKSRDSIALLKKNLESLKITENVCVSNLDAERFLTNSNQKFDIIFIDPPYKDGISQVVKDNLVSHLVAGGIIIVENEKPFSETILGAEKYDERKYGRVYLSFLRKKV